MAKKAKDDENFVDLYFPERGVNDTHSLSFMPQGFTPVGYNVRVYEALTGRGRGGSRSGLSKFIDAQHSGAEEIQHLNTITTVDGTLLGWSYSGLEQSFQGVYGGIGFLDPIPFSFVDGFPGYGGGGYPPNENVHSRTLSMSVENAHWPAGNGTTKVYVTVTDQTGDLVGSENQVLQTTPTTADGHGDVDATSVLPSGIAEFNVESSVPAIVYYRAYTDAVPPRRFHSVNQARIRFTPYKLTHTVADSAIQVNDPGVVTGTLLDPAGAAVEGATVRLNATGGTGDGTTAVTNASGVATFNVTSDTAQTVTYTMWEVAEEVHSISTNVTIQYSEAGAITFIQAAGPTNYLGGLTTETSVMASDVTTDNYLFVLLLCEADVAGNVTVSSMTDTLGNTYTQIDSYIHSGALSGTASKSVSMWYAKSIGTGANTLTVNVSASSRISPLFLEYSGVKLVSPLMDSNTNMDLTDPAPPSTTFSTGTVSVTENNSLVLGAIHNTNMASPGANQTIRKTAGFWTAFERLPTSVSAEFTIANMSTYGFGIIASFKAENP